MDGSCLFCKIINNQIPSKKIQEDDTTLVIQDIAPKAPTHYLILPKKHVRDIASLESTDMPYVIDAIKMAQTLSKNLTTPAAFNLIANNGKDAGQSVFHLHWHFLAGRNIYNEHGLQL